MDYEIQMATLDWNYCQLFHRVYHHFSDSLTGGFIHAIPFRTSTLIGLNISVGTNSWPYYL